MSHPWYLYCVETHEAVHLGKAVCFDEQHLPIPWKFGTSWYANERDEREQLWKIIERFLILNRGKEIRVVPDTFLEEIDPRYDDVKYIDIDDLDEILGRPVCPEPDVFDDLRAIPVEVITRIKGSLTKET